MESQPGNKNGNASNISAYSNDLDALIELARDKSSQSRSRLASVIGDLYSGQDRVLSDNERQMMCDIIRRIIQEVELSVRKALAERLSSLSNVHPSLLSMLANDEIEVAHPILVRSEVLRDCELIEIVQHRTMEHQMAIAMRPTLSEPLSNALIETGNRRVITAVLGNQGAEIAENDLRSLVEQADQIDAYQAPLVQRQDLPETLVRKLFWSVSAALREHLIAHYELDPTELDERIEKTVKGLLGECGDERDGVRSEHGAVSDGLPADPEQGRKLMSLLDNGDFSAFTIEFSRLTRLRVALVRRLLYEPGGEGLAVACKAIGLDKPAFASVLVQFRNGRLGDKLVETDEITRAMEFFDRTSLDDATGLVHRWQRAPEYQNALRIVTSLETAASDGR